MHPIDHVPVTHADLNELAGLFDALGFCVSDVVTYTSPDDPSGPWRCRAVFLQAGWLDLQWQPGRPAELGAAPHSCLFRAPDLDSARRDFRGLRMGPAFRLDGTWEGGGAQDFPLAWMAVRERIAPLVLGLAAYPGPHPARVTKHRNTAVEVLGLSFGGVSPGPAAGLLADRLDLYGFRYLEAEAFAALFGEPKGLMSAIRIRVDALQSAADALDQGGVSYSVAGASLFVPAQSCLGCGLEFTVGREPVGRTNVR